MRILWFLLAVLTQACVAPLSSLTRVTPLSTTTARFELKTEPSALEDEARVREAILRAVPKLSRWGELPAAVTVRIAPTHAELERAVNRSGYDWLRAWAQFDDLIIQSPGSWAGTDRDVDELILHELTHCLLFQSSGTATNWANKAIPLWFREGMATVTAEQGLRFPSLEDLSEWIKRNPDLDVFADAEQLSKEAYGQIYGVSYHAMRFLLRRLGDKAVVETMLHMKSGETFDQAFTKAAGTEPRRFEADFLNFLRFRAFRGFGLKVKPRLQPGAPDPRPK